MGTVYAVLGLALSDASLVGWARKMGLGLPSLLRPWWSLNSARGLVHLRTSSTSSWPQRNWAEGCMEA